MLLNFVLLSPIVSSGVRPKPSGQTPLGHNPPLFSAVRGLVGVRTPPCGSDRVRSLGSVSFQPKYSPGSVLRQQKTGVTTKAVVSGGVDLLSGDKR